MGKTVRVEAGTVIGKFTVIRELPERGHGGAIFWECQCVCGTYRKVRSSSIKNFDPQLRYSCGCDKADSRSVDTCYKNTYAVYRRNARKRSIPFYLTYEDFCKLITKSCIYCGTTGGNTFVRKYKTPPEIVEYKYNGIDRINSDLPYTLDNSVPCCYNCNIAKFAQTQEQFKTLITNIYNYWIKPNAL